ncbi:MAG: hypothetical protein ACRDQX_06370 [Pseudonocardiaceae bacterium]
MSDAPRTPAPYDELPARPPSATARGVAGSSAVAARGVLAAGAVSALLLAGCAQNAPPPAPLLLGGPRTDITVAIPPGWHQVIDATNPVIPEMVAPTSCMGTDEVACALGLTRVASLVAADAQNAEQLVEKVVTTSPGVKIGASISQGPGKVGAHDGYLHRFVFTNPTGSLTCEIAAVPSGPTTPDAKGDREFSVVLVWVTEKPGSPNPDVIDQIVGSTRVSVNGHPPA